MACRDRIILLQKRVLIISAYLVNSQIQEKANLSSLPRKEYRFELSSSMNTENIDLQKTYKAIIQILSHPYDLIKKYE